MEWIKNTNEDEPDADGRYLIIYHHGPIVRRFIGDYSAADGWMSMMDAEVLAWRPIPEIPDWVIDQFSSKTPAEAR